MSDPGMAAVAAVGKMPPLGFVSREWDECGDLRYHFRREKNLLQWEDDDNKKINIANASLNYLALKPLVRRLRDTNGDVGMHQLPKIEWQHLEPHYYKVVCFKSRP